MISRYNISVISDLWSLKSKYRYFLDVEHSLLKALENNQVIPSGVSKSLNDVKINTERIDQLDKEVKHDVIAFCTSITEQMPQEYKAYFHYGVTSSDIIDTALMLQMRASTDLIKDVLKRVVKSLSNQIENSQDLLGLGRSHGIYAEPMIYAQKWLGHQAEFLRRLEDLDNFNFSGQLSGAVGNYTVLTPEIEKEALTDLNLSVEDVTTQVIPRDRIADLVSIFANLGSAIERFAIEIRHLHHSDIDEVCEGFSSGQKGSSTMPHKKNPISSENLSGLSRMLRSFHSVALDNCLLWHERDISHSSSERMYLPDMFGIAYYALDRLATTVDGLTYNKEIIENKVKDHPKVFSSLILHELIAQGTYSREELYKVVQEACFTGKSLEGIIAFIEKNLNTSLEQINLATLKQHYIDQFKKTHLRVKEKYQKYL